MALMPFPDVVPSFLLQTMQSCSKCVLPVSMIVIGSILSEADIRKMLKGSTLFYCVVRLLGIPAVTMVVCRLLGMGALVTGVCTVLAGMPAGSTTAILAENMTGMQNMLLNVSFCLRYFPFYHASFVYDTGLNIFAEL